MTDISELVGGADHFSRPIVCRARVVRAPVDLADHVDVALINYSARYTYEVPAANWAAARGTTLPAVGASCMVAFDDDGDVWLLAFDGTTAFPAGGGGGGVGPYVHTQASPSATWVIAHNLGHFPAALMVVDSAGTEVYGGIHHNSTNQLTATFTAPFSGEAYVQ
jgi:hypothetical protein